MDTLKAEKAIREIAYSHLGNNNVLNNPVDSNQNNALIESLAIALAEACATGYQNASKENNRR